MWELVSPAIVIVANASKRECSAAEDSFLQGLQGRRINFYFYFGSPVKDLTTICLFGNLLFIHRVASGKSVNYFWKIIIFSLAAL